MAHDITDEALREGGTVAIAGVWDLQSGQAGRQNRTQPPDGIPFFLFRPQKMKEIAIMS
jgi:hypothetical protein